MYNRAKPSWTRTTFSMLCALLRWITNLRISQRVLLPWWANVGYGCPVGRDSCAAPKFPGNDPVTNYMNYTDDYCMFEFTAGQAQRSNDASLIYRE